MSVRVEEFLLARVAADEESAQRHLESARRGMTADRDVLEPLVWWGRVAERILAECEAKRRIVDQHRFAEDEASDAYDCPTCGLAERPCPTLRSVAAVYADHPDYREEWRP